MIVLGGVKGDCVRWAESIKELIEQNLQESEWRAKIRIEWEVIG